MAGLSGAAEPRAVVLALRLADAGLPFVVVGSTARWLRARGRPPRDLDVVVAPDDLPLLDTALAVVALPGPPWRRPLDRTAHTPYGPLDVFFDRVRGRASTLLVADRTLRVLRG